MDVQRIFERNREWVARRRAEDPEFFTRLSATHEPHFLFVGCSDARVPANVITQTAEGEMFVHRNIANQVVAGDANLLAVLEFAVEVLHVREIFVCGHYGCGGVRAAMQADNGLPFVDGWLAGIRTAMRLHDAELRALASDDARWHRLVELNVIEQVRNLSTMPVVRAAWARGERLRLHGWVYELREGLLRDLGVTMGPRAQHAGVSP